jgi:hypothetical protein
VSALAICGIVITGIVAVIEAIAIAIITGTNIILFNSFTSYPLLFFSGVESFM